MKRTYPEQLMLDPAELQPNPWNTNIVSPENEAKLDESVRRLGMFKPVVVREYRGGYQILGGKHRNDSAIRLGLKPIPVINLGPIDDLKAKEIGLADNARYGMDDTLGLAELLEELGNPHDLSSFLPWTDTDLKAIFASTTIALDDLDFDEEREEPAASEERVKAPKTHTIMRFKVPIGDSERISELIAEAQKRQGFTEADELTNAGDALVFLLLGDRDDE